LNNIRKSSAERSDRRCGAEERIDLPRSSVRGFTSDNPVDTGRAGKVAVQDRSEAKPRMPKTSHVFYQYIPTAEAMATFHTCLV
jgi:hypothetical protein